MFEDIIFRIQIWKDLESVDRDNLLREIETRLANSQNRLVCKLGFGHCEPDVFGREIAWGGEYNSASNEITLNAYHVQQSDPEAAILNLIHEGRHAFQYHCVQYPNIHLEYAHKILILTQELNHYKSPGTNHSEYANQDVEKDAVEYARSI